LLIKYFKAIGMCALELDDSVLIEALKDVPIKFYCFLKPKSKISTGDPSANATVAVLTPVLLNPA